MFTHIVFFKLKEFSVEQASEARERILAMRGKIPQLRHLEAGVDVVRSGRSWDVVLLARFDSREDLDAYAIHPVHLELVAWLSERRESACVVDYESEGG
jgi:hypothetical protein